jgi:DNA-binding transcriptional LysR family regulator
MTECKKRHCFEKKFPMVRKIDWGSQIGRRLKLRDLHVFCAVVRCGSMAKASEQLGVSQPAVSEVIAGLEDALGVRLLDRSSRGIDPNMYGRALLKRCTVVFDELMQGVSDIEFLADPTVGELRIGCPESVAAAILEPIIERFSKLYPRVVLHVWHEVSPTLELPQLRERKLDLCLVRLRKLEANEHADLNVEVLFGDQTVVAAGTRSRWASRRKIDLAELVNEAWILTPSDSWAYSILADAFRARGLAVPKASLMTHSVPLRTNLAATGDFITILPSSVLRFNPNRFALKVLPVELPVPPWPVVVVTLKNRTLSPLAQLFIEQVRAFTNSMAAELKLVKKSA